MSKRKTKYNKSSESQFNWIKPCSRDVHSAHCKLCQKNFSISGGGVTQIKSHATSKLHLAREKEREEQFYFSKDADNLIQINNPKISLSTEKEIIHLHLQGMTEKYLDQYFSIHRLLNTSSKVKRKQNTQYNTASIHTSKIFCQKIWKILPSHLNLMNQQGNKWKSSITGIYSTGQSIIMV